jgi:hypothetical protein
MNSCLPLSALSPFISAIQKIIEGIPTFFGVAVTLAHKDAIAARIHHCDIVEFGFGNLPVILLLSISAKTHDHPDIKKKNA